MALSDSNLRKIQSQIVKFSLGDFSSRLRFSGSDDYWEAVGMSLNMLGEELREITVSKQFFLNIFNAIPDLLLITDGNGRMLIANEAARRTLGLPGSGGNARFNDYFRLRGHHNAFGLLRSQYRRSGADFEHPLQLIGSDSRHFTCHFSAFSERPRSSLRYLALIKDITEMVSAQQKLAESEFKFKQIFQKSSDGIFLTDLEGYILDMNQSLRDMAALSDTGRLHINDLLTKPVWGAHSGIVQLFQQGITNKEVKLRAADGKQTDCLLSGMPVFEGKMLSGFQWMVKNIAQYKEYNNRLFQAVNHLQEQERRRIADDLHDSIGQQLSGVKFMISSLVKHATEPEQQAMLQQINASVFSIIEELRNICFDLMPGTLHHFGLLHTIEELLQRLRRIYTNISFELSYPAAMPALSSETGLHLYRIIQEFISNSLKYARCRRISIHCSLPAPDSLELLLQDDGKGFNLKKARSGTSRGIHNIISRTNACGGHTELRSNSREGTVFKITIPL